MSLALLCSGQGQQHADMFALTADAPESAPLFEHATQLLGGIDPRVLVREADADSLHRNRFGQILCSLQALAAAAVLRSVLPGRVVVAGYSVGEVAAWGVAGALSMSDTLDLVARRADIMDRVSAANEGLLYVRGMARPGIDALCRRFGVVVAIVNPGNAFVLGGGLSALRALAVEAGSEPGTHVVEVPVQLAAHTPHLAAASREFRDALRACRFHFPLSAGHRLLSGVDGELVDAAAAGCDKLAMQVSTTVHWDACLQACIEAGATTFLELGPGHALQRMVSGMQPGLDSRAWEDFRSLRGVRLWVKGRRSSGAVVEARSVARE